MGTKCKFVFVLNRKKKQHIIEFFVTNTTADFSTNTFFFSNTLMTLNIRRKK